MDRVRVDAGMLPLETDMLRTNQNAMVGLALLSEAVLGAGSVADGFSCLPTVPASLTVNLSRGQVYQPAQLEATTWSSLPVDTHSIIKQGISLDPTTLTMTPPPTVGTSVSILIQVQYADKDSDLTLRPFYNAANPTQPFSGPNNSGNQTAVTRKGSVVVGTKSGVPSVSPSIPTPDAGYIGLFVITLGYGQTQITSGNIIPYFGAPTVLAKLPAVPAAIQQGAWNAYFDTSATPNLIAGAPNPPLQVYQSGTELSVFVGNTNTTAPVLVRMPNLADRPLVRQSGYALQPGDIVRNTWIKIRDDGTQWRIVGLAQGEALRVVGAATLYVRTDGSDVTGDGSANTAALAFQTIGAAIAAVKRYAQTGAAYTIQLGIPGAYTAPNQITGVSVAIIGDPANQALYTIQGAGLGGVGLCQAYGCSVGLIGVTIANTGTIVDSVTASTFGSLSLTNVTFTCVGGSPYSHIAAYQNGSVVINGGCIIASSMGGWLRVLGGIVSIAQVTLTFLGTPTWSAYGVTCTNIGRVQPVGTPTISGAATGPRYYVDQNSVISSSGGGANFYPGSVAGTNGGSGGQYV